MSSSEDTQELVPLPIGLVRVNLDGEIEKLDYPPSGIFKLNPNESFFLVRGNPEKIGNPKRNATYVQLPETKETISEKLLELEDKVIKNSRHLIIKNLGQAGVSYRLGENESYQAISPGGNKSLVQGRHLINLEIKFGEYTLKAQGLSGSGKGLTLDRIRLFRAPR